MALASNTGYYFSNAIVGQPHLGADIDLYQSTTTPKYAVGFGFTRGDGNKYRYCSFGPLANRGTVVSRINTDTNLTQVDAVGPTSVTRRAGENLDPNAAGSRYVQLIITATAHQFDGGYLTIPSGTGLGFTYRIKGHTATAAGNPTTGNIYMDLYDPLVIALGSSTAVHIAGSNYFSVGPATGSTSVATVAGVTVTNNSAGAYGWVCTHGTIGVLQDANIGTYGRQIWVSTTTAGSVQCTQVALNPSNVSLTTEPILGYMIEPGSSSNYSTVYLQLE